MNHEKEKKSTVKKAFIALLVAVIGAVVWMAISAFPPLVWARDFFEAKDIGTALITIILNKINKAEAKAEDTEPKAS